MNLILYELQRVDCASDDEFTRQGKEAINHFLIQQLEALGITEDLARLPGYWDAQGYELCYRHQTGYPLAEVHRIRDQDLLEVIHGGGQLIIYANHPDLPAMASEGAPPSTWPTPAAFRPVDLSLAAFRPATPPQLDGQDLLVYIRAQLAAGARLVTLHLDPNPTGALHGPPRDAPNACGHARDADGRLYALGPGWPAAWSAFWMEELIPHSIQRPIEDPSNGIATFHIGLDAGLAEIR